MQFQAILNEEKTFDIEITPDEILICHQKFEGDIVRVNEHYFQINYGNKNYKAIIDSYDIAQKNICITLNGKSHTIYLKSEIDKVLQKMGVKVLSNQKSENLRAPMPGKVISILINEGEKVIKGTPLLILEAMKMENILKAGADAKVKKIEVTVGSTVEKNTLLIQLDQI